MANSTTLSHCAEEVRRHDRDRFLTALFATGQRREGLFALYAFNLEISKVRELVSEPMLGAIRLQWWREALDEIFGGAPVRRHPVAEALAGTVREYGLSREHLDRLIEARMTDLEEEAPADTATLTEYAEGTSSALVWLGLETLGVAGAGDVREAARSVGIAWAILGLLRAMPHHLRQGRIYLPQEVADRHRVSRRAMLDLKPSAELAQAVEELADIARSHLSEARRRRPAVPRQAVPALLPAALADGYLRRLARCRYDVFDRRLVAQPGLSTLRLAFRGLTGRY